jgi:hypothetical protein
MNRLKSWYLLQGKSIAYSIVAALIAIISLWSGSLQWLPFAIKFLLGLAGFRLVIHFFLLSYNISNSFMREGSQKGDRNVEFTSGTYNESVNIHGDYIQGDKYINAFTSFNFSQGASDAIDEIRNILDKLAKQYGDKEYAQQKIIDDLVFTIRRSANAKDGLGKWLKTYGSTHLDDDVKTAEEFFDLAISENGNSFWRFPMRTEKSKIKYQRLTHLLKNAQWREADEETVRLVERLMPYPRHQHGCSNIDVDQITPKELITINKIWLEASGGRFGFSVQKKIWHKINKLDRNEYSSARKSRHNLIFASQLEYDMFTEAVGWSNDMGRIYHADFDYQIDNPKGHLPAKILLLETYSPDSKYCTLSNCLFDEFMVREYSDTPLIPNWLRTWLERLPLNQET